MKSLFSSALYAGIAAGLFATMLQFSFVIPSLLEGELYESGVRIHFSTNGSPQSERAAPPLGTDWARHSFTIAFNLITYVGYGLLMAALMGYAALRGIHTSTRQGLIWGMAGFVAVQLAPAVGLPPELPGTIATEVLPRQIWWFLSIILTTAGLWMIAFEKNVLPFVGALLIAAPQVYGAPHLDTYWGIAPPELAAQFVSLSMGVAAAGWVALGLGVAYFMNKNAG